MHNQVIAIAKTFRIMLANYTVHHNDINQNVPRILAICNNNHGNHEKLCASHL